MLGAHAHPGIGARPRRRPAAESGDLSLAVAAAQNGDAFAFADLYVALFDPVHRWLRSVLRDREDASDAAQQVFMRAFEALPSLTEGSRVRSWIFSIARNLAFDRLGAASESTVAMDPTQLHERRERERDPKPPRLEPSQDADAIEYLLASLPEAQRRVLTLRFVFDLHTADIGTALGMKEDAVRQVQHRALRSLGRSFGEVPQRRAVAGFARSPVGSHAAGGTGAAPSCDGSPRRRS